MMGLLLVWKLLICENGFEVVMQVICFVMVSCFQVVIYF